MVHPAPADKTRIERRRAFIERTGAIMDCDMSAAEKFEYLFYSEDDQPHDDQMEERTPTEG